MAFYTGRVILHPEMENPTVVVITDPTISTINSSAPSPLLRHPAPAAGPSREPHRPEGKTSRSFRRSCLHNYPEVFP